MHTHTVWVPDEEFVISNLKYYKEESKFGVRARQRWELSYTHSLVREPASTFIVKEIQEMLKKSWLQNSIYSMVSFCRPGSIWTKV